MMILSQPWGRSMKSKQGCELMVKERRQKARRNAALPIRMGWHQRTMPQRLPLLGMRPLDMAEMQVEVSSIRGPWAVWPPESYWAQEK